jgi:hypothetical protein
LANRPVVLNHRYDALLTVERMKEADGSWVAKAWVPPAFAYPPVIRFAEVGPPSAAPEFLLRGQISDDIALLVNKIG